MGNPTKPGGGNKQQPYIPAGNGDKSGEYTDKSYNKDEKVIKKSLSQPNCKIRNRKGLFNALQSKLVQKVDYIYSGVWSHKVPTVFKPNSVFKKIVNGYIEEERYYDENGETYLEIHYTNHGNPKTHPVVPHIHKSRIIKGVFNHADWEEFQWGLNA